MSEKRDQGRNCDRWFLGTPSRMIRPLSPRKEILCFPPYLAVICEKTGLCLMHDRGFRQTEAPYVKYIGSFLLLRSQGLGFNFTIEEGHNVIAKQSG